MLSAIDFAIKATTSGLYNVCSINLSLGGSTTYSSPCGDSIYAPVFSAARAVGIVPVVAAGNAGVKTGMPSPACAPGAVSVGAVYDATMNRPSIAWGPCTDYSPIGDTVTCFSNSAPYMTLLAPGAVITAGGWSYAGTSQASPHVAGAVAVLKSAVPTATPAQVVQALSTSGRPITDPLNGGERDGVLGGLKAACEAAWLPCALPEAHSSPRGTGVSAGAAALVNTSTL